MKLDRSYTIIEIAEIIGAEIIGNKSVIINGISDVYHVKGGELTFADNKKYYELALSSNAEAIIVQDRFTNETNKSLLFVIDAFEAYNTLAKTFFNFIPQDELINNNTLIGENSYVAPNVYIGPNVTIGNNCYISPNVTIVGNCKINDNVFIHPGVILSAEAFYFKTLDNNKKIRLLSIGSLLVEENVEIGSNSVIERGLSSITTIKKGTKIGSSVQIGHDTVIGQNCVIAAQTAIGSNVIIEDNVTIWAQVGIQKNVVVGKDSIILGQSGVTKSLEGGKIYFGLPAIESREKMKELAYLKQIPEIIKLLSEKL